MTASQQDALRQAVQALRAGDKLQAKRLIVSILQENPANADAWFLTAFLTEDRDKKIQALEKAITFNPQHAKARDLLARLNPVSEDPLDALLAAPIQTTLTNAQSPMTKNRKRKIPLGTIMVSVIALTLLLVTSYFIVLNTGWERASHDATRQAIRLTNSEMATIENYLTTTSIAKSLTVASRKETIDTIVLTNDAVADALTMTLKAKSSTPTNTPMPSKTAVPTSTITPTLDSEDIGKWMYGENISEFDDSSSYYALMLPAEKEIEGWLDSTVPWLSIVCTDKLGKVGFLVDVRVEIDYRQETSFFRLKWDNGSIETLDLIADSDRKIVIFPNPSAALWRMVHSKKLAIQFTPFQGNTQDTWFDLRGLPSALKQLKGKCPIKGFFPS